MKPIIAIDGPAASGKGTLARSLAEKLNYAHLDTGAIYRMVALYLLQQNLKFSPDAAVFAAQDVAQNQVSKTMGPPELPPDK